MKTYAQATGQSAQRILDACEHVARKGGLIGVAPQAFDLSRTLEHASMYAQHLDCGEPGRNTGFILAQNAKKLGVSGTILNHSEHKLTRDLLERTLAECRQQSLRVILCADSVQEARELAQLQPDYIAVEPPELIGGDVSVTTQPEIITESLQAVQGVPLLVGAGVKTREDVQKALELGAVGVLVASGIVLHKDPTSILKEFAL